MCKLQAETYCKRGKERNRSGNSSSWEDNAREAPSLSSKSSFHILMSWCMFEQTKDIREENANRFSDKCKNANITLVFKEEIAQIHQKISVKHLAVIFCDTSRIGEALAIKMHFSSLTSAMQFCAPRRNCPNSSRNFWLISSHDFQRDYTYYRGEALAIVVSQLVTTGKFS